MARTRSQTRTIAFAKKAQYESTIKKEAARLLGVVNKQLKNASLWKEMNAAVQRLDFEQAIVLRDQIYSLNLDKARLLDPSLCN